MAIVSTRVISPMIVKCMHHSAPSAAVMGWTDRIDLEAYWRSVAWPAQGVFVGEPLEAPFAR